MTILNYQASPYRPGNVLFIFCAVTFTGAWCMLGFCYLIDFLSMTFPQIISVRDTDLIFTCPLLLAAACLTAMRKVPLAKRIAWSLISMTLGTVLAEILIILMYSPLHSSIINAPIAR